MADKKKPDGDYKVGHGRPPKEHQWKAGQSGNPKGRPKSRKAGSTDLSALLNEPVKVKAGGKDREMHPFEASVRQLAIKALGGHQQSIFKFIKICEEYGVIEQQDAERGGVIFAPKGVSPEEWVKSMAEDRSDEEA